MSIPMASRVQEPMAHAKAAQPRDAQAAKAAAVPAMSVDASSTSFQTIPT